MAGETRGRQRVHHLPRRHEEADLRVRSGDHHLPGQHGGHRADQRPEDGQDAAGGGAAPAQTQGPHQINVDDIMNKDLLSNLK